MKGVKGIGFLFFCFVLLDATGLAQSVVITTVAGNGTAGSGGDGGPATSAQLNWVSSLAVDPAGNLYFTDEVARTVRKVTPQGMISTVIGNLLSPPRGVAVDSSGNVYVTENNKIIKVTPAGVINTTQIPIYYMTDITVDLAGNLYIADFEFFSYVPISLHKISPDGIISEFGIVPEDSFGLAVDSAGNLYSAGGQGVWKLEPQGMVTSVPSCPCCTAADVAIDSAGNLFVADGNAQVCKVTPSGIVTVVAGNGTVGFSGDGGPATSAQLNRPSSVAVDSTGNLLISDVGNRRIRKVTFEAGSAAGCEIFYPHVAVGGGYDTSFALSNTGDSAISGDMLLTDQQGQPLVAKANDIGSGSSFPISIRPGGTMFLTVNPLNPNDSLKSGWAKLTTACGVIHGIATLRLVSDGLLQTVAGVLPSEPIQSATISVDDDYNQGRLTAYALANPSSQNLIIKLALVNQDGKVVDDTVTYTLAPKQQMTRYLYQDLARQQFRGSMVLQAQQGGSFVAMALLQHQKLMTVIPVIPGKAPHIPD